MSLLLLVGYLMLAVAAAHYAGQKGRSGILWFLLSLLISPLITLLVLAALGPDNKGLISSGALKKCPQCAEMIQAEAKICRYCRTDLVNSSGQLANTSSSASI